MVLFGFNGGFDNSVSSMKYLQVLFLGDHRSIPVISEVDIFTSIFH